MVQKRNRRAALGHRWALISGASGGIGQASARRIASLGYHIIAGYNRDQSAADELVKTLEEQGFRGVPMLLNLTDREGVERGLAAWQEQHPEDAIEVLVLSGGIRQDELLVFMEPKQWDEVISVNLNGFYNLTRPVLRSMIHRRYGRVIAVTSLSGITGMAGQTNYSASKGGIIAATKALALEVAARGITANAVAPGFIRTAMTADLDEQELANRIPIGRFGTPEEVAQAIAFLADEQSAYITGQVIELNGGLHT